MRKKKEIKKVSCPICKSSVFVGKVISLHGANVAYVNYCRECYVEFDNKGVLKCPTFA